MTLPDDHITTGHLERTPMNPRSQRSAWRLVAALAAGLALLLLAPTAAHGDTGDSDDTTISWGTAPTDNEVGEGRPRFSYTAEPGGTLRDSIDVINRSDRPLKLGIYAADAFTTESGGLDLLTADQPSVDVGTWIALERTQVRVPAHGTVSVPFVLTVPENATPGDHTGGIVTSFVTQAESGVGIDRRIGTRMYIRVGGQLDPQLKVGDVHTTYDGSAAPWSPGSATVRYTVTNTGNVRLEAGQEIRVAGPFGLLGASTAPDDLAELLPGNSRSFEVMVDGAWPTGRLTATVTLHPTASTQDQAGAVPDIAAVEGSASTWAIPWPQLALLAALALAVYALLQLRNRRRAKMAAAIDQAVTEALAGRGTPTP